MAFRPLFDEAAKTFELQSQAGSALVFGRKHLQRRTRLQRS
jgi:hypothetical protein